MKRFILILTILSSSYSFGQKLDCSNLKNGIFFSNVKEPFKMKLKITRHGNFQTEEIIEIDNEIKKMGYPIDPHYELIEWIDDCTYRLKYDESKSELTENQKIINESGGVLTQILSIDGKCYTYSSTLAINGESQIMEGKLCSE